MMGHSFVQRNPKNLSIDERSRAFIILPLLSASDLANMRYT